MKKSLAGLVCRAWLVYASVFMVACSGDNGSGTSGGVVKGTLQFQPASSISVVQGSTRQIQLQLVGSSGVTNQTVTITADDPNIASLQTTSCNLSTGNNATCTVTINGVLATNNFTLTASAPGYANAQATGQVVPAASTLWGSISVYGANNGASTYSYNTAGTPTVSIVAQLLNSSGVTSGSGVTAMVNAATGLSFPSGSSCPLTTASPSCTITATITNPSTSTITTTLVPSGAGAANYPTSANTTNLSFTGSGGTNPVNPALGTITINTVNAAGFYAGMNGPLFATWTNGTGTDTYQVVLSTNTNNLQFYAYPAGNNTSRNLAQQSNAAGVAQPCQMTLAGGSPNSSCGFNVNAASSASGSATVSCTVTNLSTPGGAVPQCNAATFALAAPPAGGRQITFKNNLPSTVSLGVTSGTASSLISATAASGSQANSGHSNAAVNIAANAACGSSSGSAVQTACPTGSTCMQGGNPAGGPYYCYWDTPAGAGSNIAANGGTVTLTVPSVSGLTSGNQQIQWSGNYYVYGTDCIAGVSNKCSTTPSPGQGPLMAAVTLAEVTYQHNTDDYYDVSIINGLNYALGFGPTNPAKTPQSYVCGTAGGGTGANTSDLGASSWTFTPPSANYVLVMPNGTSSSSPVSTGWNMSLVGGSYAFDPSTQVSGPFYGYTSADQLWGWNSTSGNHFYSNAPFNFGAATYEGQTALTGPNGPVRVGDLQLCVNGTFTDYSGPTAQSPYMACGGVNWGAGSGFSSTWGGSPTQLTTPSMGVTYVNPNWTSNVLPTIAWLKQGCPTCYTFPYDDKSSTFQCSNATGGGSNTQGYTINISDISGSNHH